MKIYYDNSATTKVDPKVFETMAPYLQEEFGNSGSMHSFGQKALAAVDKARDQVARFLGCEAQEIIFTSGATESNNLILQGVVKYFTKQNKEIHIITSQIEHPAVLEVCKELEKRPMVEVDYVKVDKAGIIDLEQLESKIKDNTVLVSIMYANNEVGSIQPLKKVDEILKQVQTNRGSSGLPIYFHTDAVQAVNYLDCKVDNLGVDFLSLSGHKIYGPKGVGALYIRAAAKLEPIICGGHQEYNLRPGTLNVPGVAGLGEAIELVGEESKKVKKIKEQIVKELENIENVRFNGESESQLPNLINISFLKAEGESILMMLDMEGIAISTGSACSSGSLEPSHVLTAMGIKPEWSHGSVRISLGRFNSEDEISHFIKVITSTIKKLRQMAP
ncbi:cysteine desulfurase [Candidatus Falkowbacteria bacterium]|jgi:cysteine desulfurase|nr:cysteine desulfurase [Candidatus Falkowbacteria bacterium]MBT5503545.1 cysteine desulfurase [Candidatus Falkowbacteria bacterium]MBT6573582.1 cysteine desulfurase [Candidatus Falkowbacteria bacterium]MBT7348390.1 cysteine desulfurase [Candidatus Falkowbacteria bacterium]MBT7500656.1 cysteine desulfurase [Candidatus Falkowbacteria bacterium]